MKVRIYQPHTLARIKYTPGPDGIELDVSPADAAFLKSIGALDKPAPAAAKPPAPAADADRSH